MAQVKSLIKEVFENLGKNTKVKGVFVNPTLRGKGVKEEEIRWAGLEIDPQKAYSKEELLEIESRRKDRMRVLESDSYQTVSIHQVFDHADNYNARVYQFKEADQTGVRYTAPHFGHGETAQNYLMHARTFDAIAPDGIDGRVLQEIQSDLHQRANQEGGYATPTEDLPLSVTRAYLDELEDYRNWLQKFYKENERGPADFDEFHDKMEEAENMLNLTTNGSFEVADKIEEMFQRSLDPEVKVLSDENFLTKWKAILNMSDAIPKQRYWSGYGQDGNPSYEDLSKLGMLERDIRGHNLEIDPSSDEGERILNKVEDLIHDINLHDSHPFGFLRHQDGTEHLPPVSPFKSSWAQKVIEQEYVKALNEGKGEIAIPISGPSSIMDKLSRSKSVQKWYEEVIPKIAKRIANNPNANSTFKMEKRTIFENDRDFLDPDLKHTMDEMDREMMELGEDHTRSTWRIDDLNVDFEDRLISLGLMTPRVEEALNLHRTAASNGDFGEFENLVDAIQIESKTPMLVRRALSRVRARITDATKEGTVPIVNARLSTLERHLIANDMMTSEIKSLINNMRGVYDRKQRAKYNTIKNVNKLSDLISAKSLDINKINYAVIRPVERQLSQDQKNENLHRIVGTVFQQTMGKPDTNPLMKAQQFKRMYEKEFGHKYNDIYDFMRDLSTKEPLNFEDMTNQVKFYLYSSPFSAIWSAYFMHEAGKDPSEEMQKAGLDKVMSEDIENQAKSIQQLLKSGMTLEEIKEHMEAQYGAEL